MKILFLDDMETRHEWARETWGSQGEVHHVRTMFETFAKIREGEWDVISLDHDLGGDQMVVPGTAVNSGTGLTKAMQEFAAEFGVPEAWKKARWIVHSWNAYAAKVMGHDLKALGLNVVISPAAVM